MAERFYISHAPVSDTAKLKRTHSFNFFDIYFQKTATYLGCEINSKDDFKLPLPLLASLALMPHPPFPVSNLANAQLTFRTEHPLRGLVQV